MPAQKEGKHSEAENELPREEEKKQNSRSKKRIRSVRQKQPVNNVEVPAKDAQLSKKSGKPEESKIEIEQELIPREEIDYWQQKRASSWQREFDMLKKQGLPISQTFADSAKQQIPLEEVEGQDPQQYQFQVSSLFTPYIEGFTGNERQLEDIIEVAATKLNINWNLLLKDARSMVQMLSDRVVYSQELEISCWQFANLDLVDDQKFREEILWARQLRTYHCQQLSILSKLLKLVTNLVYQQDLKSLLKLEQDKTNIDRQVFDAKLNREKRLKPKEEKKQEATKMEIQLKIDSEQENSKKLTDTAKPKIETRGINNFFKPKQKPQSGISKSKAKVQILNPLLKGLQVYETEAKKQQSTLKMNWNSRQQLIEEMKRLLVTLPERSYSIKNVIINDSRLTQINQKFILESWVNPRAPLARVQQIQTYDMDSEDEKELLMAEQESLNSSEEEENENDWDSYDGLIVDDLSASEIDDDFEGEKQGKDFKLERLKVARQRQKMHEAKRQAMFNLGNQMKYVAQTENLDDYTVVAFAQFQLPIAIKKQEKQIMVKPEEDIKTHIQEVVAIVHGNGKNKEDLIKEVREKVPGLTRKSAQIAALLKNCFTKTDVDGFRGKRQMADIEKLTAAYGQQEQLNLDELLASRKAKEPELPVILTKRKSTNVSRKSVTPTKATKRFDQNLKQGSLLYEADDENPVKALRQRPKSVMRPQFQHIIVKTQQVPGLPNGVSTPSIEQLNNF